MTPTSELPRQVSVAFKEWAGVCRALAQGRQSLILRKGGMAEGRGGFVPEHDEFWLYPTHVHQAEQGLKDQVAVPPPPPGVIEIGVLARVEGIERVERLEPLLALDDLHAWTEETIAKRFHYREPGLWVLIVRALVRPEPHRLPITPEHAGCRTWVPLECPLTTDGLSPTLDDDAFADRRRAILERLARA